MNRSNALYVTRISSPSLEENPLRDTFRLSLRGAYLNKCDCARDNKNLFEVFCAALCIVCINVTLASPCCQCISVLKINSHDHGRVPNGIQTSIKSTVKAHLYRLVFAIDRLWLSRFEWRKKIHLEKAYKSIIEEPKRRRRFSRVSKRLQFYFRQQNVIRQFSS